jgi:hypothetical protein
METPSIVDVLIQNIETDQELLLEAEITITGAKEKKAAIAERLKDYRKEIVVILKYANEEQKQQIEALGFDTAESSNGLNTVATLAMDIIMKAKDTKLNNEVLYNAYVETFENKGDAVNYTEFNIKCRPLFNSQRIIRTKAVDGLSSRADIISLNGTLLKKEEEPKDDVEVEKETSDIKNDVKESDKKEAPKTIALKKGTLEKDKKDDTTAKKK